MTSSVFNYQSKNIAAAESIEIQSMFGAVMGAREPGSEFNVGLVNENTVKATAFTPD